MVTNFLIILLSYILGSIPFGYVFAKISGKEILKIGWRKTSGSNVFKNVGAWQGIVTGLCDVGKGFLAVFIAQKLNLPLSVQALCGAAAVVGHNWSLFLKFSGGRGIGTLIGAILPFSFEVLSFSLIPLVFFALVWNAAIGTLLFLIALIFFSFRIGYFETVGILTLVCLLPIFIKRLSPIEEIKKAENKNTLVRNRLVFDDDIARFDLRITRLIKRLTKK